jgi:FtsP/CotA-like multicopper oxidase with cupredoxin domain
MIAPMDRRGFLQAGAVGTAAALAAACSRSAPPPNPGADISLVAGETDIDLGGVTVRTWAWGAQVPGKEIRLRKGQRLRAELSNTLPQGTTVHWHGLTIPNAMDGVPVLTQAPVATGDTFRYEFVVPDAGTYWAHSHQGTQPDRGLYAPLIIEDPDEKAGYDDELVIVLDDWIDGTGINPDQVLANLQKTGMKPMAPGAGVSPTSPLGTDGGDVTYPYFLINGRVPTDPQVADYRAGQRIRLRVINAGSDTAFRVGVPGTALSVTHTDGYPVVPMQADSVILGMGERVDAVITLGSSVPVIAAPEGKQGHAQLNLRVDGKQSGVNVDEFVAALRRQVVLDTATLSPTPEVTLPARPPDQVLDLRLSGPVNGYTWPINGKLYDPPHNGLAVKAGQRVRLRLINESMMFHPIHLHGHTFEVQGPDGTPRARKDTVLVAPMQTVAVDFDTDNPGQWIIHCHNTYHLEAGMGTFIFYSG